jgi:hypothetical protein
LGQSNDLSTAKVELAVNLGMRLSFPFASKTRFKDFYRDMLKRQVKRADMRAGFTEYAWDKNWCDAGAADPLSFEELPSLGVFPSNETSPDFVPGRGRRPVMPPMGGARDDFVTPMYIRHQMNLPTAGDGGWPAKTLDPFARGGVR